ncbi:purine NTPase [Legionella nautarum]|uniref:Purine NTPase n=1 Tax=Legionella nautarum TaxID=45070 RepID=A0A0W0WUM1_9GAMM|nr:hypothetical protein [Legionella nautarum]KTD36009.1 purine NTPase [Legionella nautarum]
MSKEAIYKGWFQDWRREKADKEDNCLNTAILIGSYVEKATLDEIKADFHDHDSPLFAEFARYGKRTYGALAFGRLGVYEYMECLQSSAVEEKELLNKVIESIDGLYDNPTSGTLEKIETLIKVFNDWIEKFAEKNPNREQVINAFKSIYMVLKIADLTLNNLPTLLKMTVNRIVNINVFHEQVKDLLDRTENKIRSLTVKAAQEDSSSGVIGPATIAEHLHAINLTILKTREIPLMTRVMLVQQRTSNMVKALASFDELRGSLELLAKKKENAAKLLRALVENNQKPTGRLYFLDFIAKNKANFDEMIAYADDDQDKQELIAIWKELLNPTAYRKTVSFLQYATSITTSIPGCFFRYTAPGYTNAVSKYLPATIDSAAKNKVEKLINSYLAKLSEQIDKVKKVVEASNDKIAHGDERVKLLILNSASVDLDQAGLDLAKSQDAEILVYELIEDVENKRKILQSVEDYEREVEALDKKLKEQLAKPQNIMISFFGYDSELAKIAEKITRLKITLTNLKVEYTAAILEDTDQLSTNEGISEQLRECILAEIACSKAPSYAQTKEIDGRLQFLSVQDHYNLIDREFSSFLKTRVTSQAFLIREAQKAEQETPSPTHSDFPPTHLTT